MFTTVRAGTNVTLNCTDLGAAGPGDTVSWAGGGTVGDTLPLIRVDQSHSGVYTCAVSRGAEGDRLLHVSLLVSHPPALTSPRYRVAQQLGRPVQLDCEVKIQHILKLLKYFYLLQVSAVPVPAVSWRYSQEDGTKEMVESGDTRYITIQVRR